MKVSILGSGNGAHAAAFDWAKAGCDVYMYDFPQFHKSTDAITEKGGIEATGKLQGFQKIVYAGSDLEKVLEDADLIFAVGPSYSTEPFGKACAPYVKAGQTYIIMPGSCMGALTFKRALNLAPDDYSVTIAETSTLPYAVRISGPASIEVHHCLPAAYMVAAIPKSKGREVHEQLSKVYPGIEIGESVFHTTLQNSNPIIHPVVSTLNAGLIERTQGDFEFYSEGITPAVARLMEGVDMERIAIGRAMGLYIERSPEKGVRQGYMTVNKYYEGYSTSEAFAGIKAQSQLDHRYYNEDLGYTTIFFIDLAKKLGVEVPVMDSLVTIISTMMDRDYRKEAPRTLETLGLGSFTVEQLLAL